MSVTTSSENMIAKWVKPIPNLPAAGQKWLAENIWWLAVISLVLSIIGIFVSIGSLVTALTFTSTYDIYGYAVANVYGGAWIAAAIVGMVFTVVRVIILATAISPLKNLNKKGWNLMFLLLLVSAVQVVVVSIVGLNVFSFIFGIIFGAIGLAIGAYFLFQIKSHFGAKSAAKVVAKK